MPLGLACVTARPELPLNTTVLVASGSSLVKVSTTLCAGPARSLGVLVDAMLSAVMIGAAASVTWKVKSVSAVMRLPAASATLLASTRTFHAPVSSNLSHEPPGAAKVSVHCTDAPEPVTEAAPAGTDVVLPGAYKAAAPATSDDASTASALAFLPGFIDHSAAR